MDPIQTSLFETYATHALPQYTYVWFEVGILGKRLPSTTSTVDAMIHHRIRNAHQKAPGDRSFIYYGRNKA